MSEVAPTSAPDASDDPEITVCVRMIRAALDTLPPAKREIAKRALDDEAPLRAPQRGGTTLNNVVRLFRDDKRTMWNAQDVLDELDKRGLSADRKAVYNALTYLSSSEDMSRRILRKVGYGRYQLMNGDWIEGPP